VKLPYSDNKFEHIAKIEKEKKEKKRKNRDRKLP
jgi:hypothetical protein